jgi:GNAT superfamily N-acetyltransferase
VRIAPLVPAHRPALLAMLRRCSPATLFHRFHGVTDGVPYAERLVADRGHRSLTAWAGDDCVGLATLAGGAGGHELGVLVEDAWQRRRVGTALVAGLLGSARAGGVGELVADVLAEDAFVLASLRRLGPVRTSLECGVYTARVALGAMREAQLAVAGSAETPCPNPMGPPPGA